MLFYVKVQEISLQKILEDEINMLVDCAGLVLSDFQRHMYFFSWKRAFLVKYDPFSLVGRNMF